MAATALCSCNVQKHNTPLSRQYAAFITRYNIHYNGDKHYRETLADMENSYADDYTRLLPMHPVEAVVPDAEPESSGLFNRSIEKAQKAIQIRSIKKKPHRHPGRSRDIEYREWLKRDEYNPFLHNDWLMLAKSQYFNGDFANAAATFLYIAKHFAWLPATVTEARLWQARCYVSLGWLDEADMLLTRIKSAQFNRDADLTDLYNYVYADYCLHRRQYRDAIPYLEAAAAHASGAQRTRLTFLLGQLRQLTGDKAGAWEAYRKAGSGASTPYDTKINARIKQSEVVAGADVADEIKALKRLTRYERNKQYAGRICYAIGNLQLSQGDTAAAISSYRHAVATDGHDEPGLAQAQLALGALYYRQGRYLQAQPCYAAAMPLIDRSVPGYDSIARRSDVLDKFAVYARNAHLQDSLIKLAALSPAEQRAAAEVLVAKLKQREQAEARARAEAQYMSMHMAGGIQDTRARRFSINSDDSWYFYNQAAKSAGMSEFQRQWGVRKLEDDWRRSNKYTLATTDFDEDEDTYMADADDTPLQRDSVVIRSVTDPHRPEFYLAQIPSTPAELALANDIVQESLYNMGLILMDDMNDPSAAAAEWKQLLSRYPDNAYRLDIYYNMYMMEMRRARPHDAEYWRDLVLSQFPDSPYGIALRNPSYFEQLMQMDRRQEQLYAETYRQYLANENDSVHAAAAYMHSVYPTSELMPRFMLLDALAYLTDGNPQRFRSTLRELVARYPEAANSDLASAWLRGISQGRPLRSTAENMRGMAWVAPLETDSAGMDSLQVMFDPFTRDVASPQVIALVFPADAVSANELLYQIARHNFSTFVVKDFDLEVLSMGTDGIILISGFDDINDVNRYKALVNASETFALPPGVRMVSMSRADFDTLMRQGLSLDDYFLPAEQ